MDKKILGIRIGTLVLAIVSLVVAILIWFYVEYDKASADEPHSETGAVYSEVNDEC